MDHFREIRNTLSWHNEGKFNAELINGVITKINFCEPGKGPADAGKCLTSTNFKYLQSVYTCLGELFTFIEEENKRLGYKYAQNIEMPHHAFEDMEDVYPVTETKLRTLINYENSQEGEDNKSQNIELSA